MGRRWVGQRGRQGPHATRTLAAGTYAARFVTWPGRALHWLRGQRQRQRPPRPARAQRALLGRQPAAHLLCLNHKPVPKPAAPSSSHPPSPTSTHGQQFSSRCRPRHVVGGRRSRRHCGREPSLSSAAPQLAANSQPPPPSTDSPPPLLGPELKLRLPPTSDHRRWSPPTAPVTLLAIHPPCSSRILLLHSCRLADPPPSVQPSSRAPLRFPLAA